MLDIFVVWKIFVKPNVASDWIATNVRDGISVWQILIMFYGGDGSYPLNNMRVVQYDRDTFIEESGMRLLEFW